MLSLKHVLPAAALLLLLNACGAAPTETAREVPKAPQVETSSGTTASQDSPSSFVRVDAGNGESVFACSYSINGKTVEGKSQEECERLKKDFEKAAGSDTQVACAFNINGKLYEGKTQAECDKLKKDLGITLNIPNIPAPAPVPTPAPGTSTQVACAFNINGKLYEGKTQAECDKLKKDLGLQF